MEQGIDGENRKGANMSFCRKTTVKKPIKRKRCRWCGEYCEIGEPRVYWAGYVEDFWTATTHTECAEAVDRYYNNEESHGWSDEWPEEYCIRGKTWFETCKAWADACANGKAS